jgi:hypothetical protein
MENSLPKDIVAAVSLGIGDRDVRLEKLSTGQEGETTIRISDALKGQHLSGPLELSEEQLIELLHRGIHAGVISHGFIGKLHEKIEI